MTHSYRIIALSAAVVAAGAVIAACAESGAQSDPARLTWSADTLYAESHLLRDLSDSAPGADLFQRPLSIRAIGTRLYVGDAGADRVAILDSAGNVVQWIGVRGSGPGELFGVAHLATHDSRLFIGEARNGRVSEFTASGEFVRTFISPMASGAIASSGAELFSMARSSTHYARLLTSAEPSFALSRGDSVSIAQRAREHAVPGHDLIAADSQHTWIFDQATASVCRFASSTSRPSCSSLPTSLVRRLRTYTDERVTAIEAASQMHVSAAPLAKDMIRVGTWLALLLPLPELPIVLIDTNDGTLTPVVGHPFPGWARTAHGFTWDGHAFVLVGDEGLGRIYVGRKPAPE